MLSVETARNSALNEILSFTYPKLHTGSCWFISFYAFDPAKGEMRRKRIKINSVGNASQRRRYAAQVCHRLSTKLETGWNPWVEAEADYTYKLFSDVLVHYRNYLRKLQDDGVLRKSTVHGYNCSAGIMERWNAQQASPIRYVYQFDRSFCVRFLDYVYVERGNSPTTRNNNLAFLREFSSFLVQHLYLKSKPTEGLKSIGKGAGSKNRTVIAPADMQRLHDWLDAHTGRSCWSAISYIICLSVRRRYVVFACRTLMSLNKRSILTVRFRKIKNRGWLRFRRRFWKCSSIWIISMLRLRIIFSLPGSGRGLSCAANGVIATIGITKLFRR